MLYLSFAKSKPLINNSDLLRSIMGEAGFALRSNNFFNIETLIIDEPRLPPNFYGHINALKHLLDQDIEKKFIYFRIPKASSGFRQIEAPEEEYKTQLRDITDVLTKKFKLLPHNASYAYTRGRSAKDALIFHQENKARWFLKMDLKDFFTSISKEYLIEKLPNIFPFNFLDSDTICRLAEVAVNNDGVLPQGSPLSPLLSNLMMVEFDNTLSHTLKRFERDTYYYTRYADDLLISSPYDFKYEPLVKLVEDIIQLQGSPFKVNKSKTRYQSFSGSNWNLGLMYNNKRNITIGSKKKKEYSFLLDLFLRTFNTSEQWEAAETMSLVGKLGYLQNIEPRYFEKMLRKYETKYSKDYLSAIKIVLG